MGLFNSRSRRDDDLAIAAGAKDGKIYKIVQLVAISVFIIAIVLLVLEIFRLLKMGSAANGIVFSLGVIALGGLTALPWVRVFESIKDKKFTITAIVFLSVIGLCVILWIVSVWQIIGLVKGLTSDADEKISAGIVGSLNVIRIALIVSLQFIIASGIAMNFVKYRKELIPYQVMFGVSTLYMDIYFTLLLTAFTVTKEDGFGLSRTSVVVTNMWLIALLVIAVLLLIFPSNVFRRVDRKRVLAAKKENLKEILADEPQSKATASASNETPFSEYSNGGSVEEKLKKIKNLLDEGMITQEEYDAKRAEILSNI